MQAIAVYLKKNGEERRRSIQLPDYVRNAYVRGDRNPMEAYLVKKISKIDSNFDKLVIIDLR